MELEVDLGRAVIGVGAAVGEMKSVREVLAATCQIEGVIVVYEGRENQSAQLSPGGSPYQWNPCRQTEQQRDPQGHCPRPQPGWCRLRNRVCVLNCGVHPRPFIGSVARKLGTAAYSAR